MHLPQELVESLNPIPHVPCVAGLMHWILLVQVASVGLLPGRVLPQLLHQFLCPDPLAGG